jgi:hypothetical protein
MRPHHTQTVRLLHSVFTTLHGRPGDLCSASKLPSYQVTKLPSYQVTKLGGGLTSATVAQLQRVGGEGFRGCHLLMDFSAAPLWNVTHCVAWRLQRSFSCHRYQARASRSLQIVAVQTAGSRLRLKLHGLARLRAVGHICACLHVPCWPPLPKTGPLCTTEQKRKKWGLNNSHMALVVHKPVPDGLRHVHSVSSI